MATTQSNGEYEVSDDLSALDVLLDGDIDKVMANLDRIVEAAPSYRKLISRWENQGWSSETFDFTRDAEEWNDGTTLDRGGAAVHALRPLRSSSSARSG